MTTKTSAAYAAAAATLPPAPLGTGGHSFVWIASGGGSWNMVGNWTDTTSDPTLTLTAPGSSDDAEIDGPSTGPGSTITGPGTAAYLTVTGAIRVASVLTPKFIYAKGPSAITVLPSGSLSAAEGLYLENSTILVSGRSASFFAYEASFHGASLLSATGGGAIVLQAAYPEAGTHLAVDATSTFVIGSGTPTPGTIIVGAQVVGGAGFIDSPIAFDSSGLGGIASENGTLILASSLTGIGKTYVDANSTLAFAGTATTTVPITFNGIYSAPATLSIRALSSGLNVQGSITGFGLTTTLAVVADPSLAVTSVGYTPGSSGSGTLALYDGATQLGVLTLAGDFTGETFQVAADAALNTYDVGVYAAGTGPANAPNAPATYAIGATDAVKYETNGVIPFTLTVTRAGSTASAQILSYGVSSASTAAVTGADFVGGVLPTGTISFAAGDKSETITLLVQGNTSVQASRAFNVTLSGAAPITTSVAQVSLDTTYSTYLMRSIPFPSVFDPAVPYRFGITRAAYTGPQTIHYAVVGVGANPATAADFGGVLPTGAIVWADGQTSTTVAIQVPPLSTPGPDKTFQLVLTDVPANLGRVASGIATIVDEAAPAPPAGTTTPDNYAWRSPVAGAWSSAGNWTDLSNGAEPAATAPGVNDTVTIVGASGAAYPTITGPGAANSLLLQQNLTIASNLTTNTLTVGSATTPGAVIIGPHSVDTAQSTSIVFGNIVVSGTGAQLLIAGALSATTSSSSIDVVSATGGGFIDAGSLVLQPGPNLARITVDATSALEIGHTGNPAAGVLTIDPGATVSGAGALETTIVDNGTIQATGGTLSSGLIAGTGQIQIAPGATFQANNPVAISGPINIGAGATLQLAGTDGITTAPIAFTAGSGTLGITGDRYQAWINDEGTIAGFVQGDTIAYLGNSTTALTDIGYTPNAAGTGGTLSLFDNNALLGNLNLLGDYTGALFTTTPTTTAFTYTISVARPDPLFDPAYYLAHNPDVAAAGVDPYQHFITYGWKEDRDPSALFDTNFYLQQNPDVAAAGVNPLAHFEAYGWKENRDPSLLFSDSQYLAAYPDVKAAGADPLLHYTLYGQQDGRMTFLSGGTAPADPLVDPTYYDPQLGATLLPTGTPAAQQAAASYAATGWQQGLNPDALFDTNYYLSHNPDVAAAHVDPLLHYEVYGWQEGRDPSAQFSTGKYLAAYADVKQANTDPLLHYLEYGQAEGRQAIHV